MNYPKFKFTPRIFFGEHYKHYIKLRQVEKVSDKTVINETKVHKCFWEFLEEFFPDTENELDVSKEKLFAYANHVQEHTSWSDSTKNQRLIALRPFYKVAYKHGWLNKDYSKFIAGCKFNRAPPEILTIEQMKELLSLPDLTTFDGFRSKTMFELLYSTGMRVNELLTLELDAFPDDYRRVTIKGKGGRVDVVPVGRLASHYVKFYIENIREFFYKPVSNFVFLSFVKDQAVSYPVIHRELEKYKTVMGIKTRLSPHTFRYSIATHLAELGTDIRLIQEFLRHDSINTTAKYIRVDLKKLKKVHAETHPLEQ